MDCPIDPPQTTPEPAIVPQPVRKPQPPKTPTAPNPKPIVATKPAPTPPAKPATLASSTNNEPESTQSDTIKNADALLLEAIRAAQQADEKPTTTATDTQPAIKEPVKNTNRNDSSSDSGTTVVQAIEFQSWPEDNSSAVVFKMKNPGTYQLVEQGENRYELRLPAAALGGSHLILPQFPPENFKEFDVIMARQTGNTVLIKIFISKGVKLYPAKIDNSIWLKTAE